MKYLKTILYEFIILISLSIFISILYYFDIISSNFNYILKIIIFIITFFLSGIYIGKRSIKKYYLEGLKISLINIILFILLTLLFKNGFTLKQLLYYFLLTIITTLGSIVGGSLKRKK